MNSKVFRWFEIGTITLGASGLILVVMGGGSCFLGISGKAVQKLANVIKPHQAITQKMVNYGAGLGFVGLFLAGSGVIIAKTLGESEIYADFIEEFEANSESLNKTTDCHNCIYFSDNTYLSCAVNPDVPADCGEFIPISAKLPQ